MSKRHLLSTHVSVLRKSAITTRTRHAQRHNKQPNRENEPLDTRGARHHRSPFFFHREKSAPGPASTSFMRMQRTQNVRSAACDIQSIFTCRFGGAKHTHTQQSRSQKIKNTHVVHTDDTSETRQHGLIADGQRKPKKKAWTMMQWQLQALRVHMS
ncbi:hypothetical protein BC940DRAFT_312972, partial [Gongronella butleri]